MSRTFNTAGPSVPGKHYMIDPLTRIDLAEIEDLIAKERYFVLHAPRQTGKTTSLLALMHHLNQRSDYRACYANIQDAHSAGNDVAMGLRAVCIKIASAALDYLGDDRLRSWFKEAWEDGGAIAALGGLLARWSRSSDRPVVLMLDEVDALVGETLKSVLLQIRSGYVQRPNSFPQTVILCGVKDIQDYPLVSTASPFNILAKSLRLGNFSPLQTQALWLQHQEETGQQIEPAIFPKLWEDTRGQPWLVNALGNEATWEDQELRDRSKPVTLEHYFRARERLIQARATHLNQLAHRLQEDRVRPIISDILQGKTVNTSYPADDLRYVEDLGLIETQPEIRIANRIYQEVIPRELTRSTQLAFPQQTAWYVRGDGRLDFPKLLAAFQRYFRKNSDSWMGSEKYREAGAQLLMQTFLQRIANGEGRIDREYALGSGRVDLCAQWPLDRKQGFHGPVQKVAIELKVVRDHDGLDATLAKGIEQLSAYAGKLGADESYLVLFDQRPGKTWEERIWQRTERHASHVIGIWGM
jgi:hypothetical protein